MAYLAKAASLKEVAVIVKELDDTELAVETLIANEFRQDLDPWERAEYLQLIKEKVGINTDVEIGKLVGMSINAIQNAWKYLNIDEEVKDKVAHAQLSHRAATEIGAIPDKETQRKVADIAIKKDMTVKQTQDLVSTIKKAHEPLSKAIIEEEVDEEVRKKKCRYALSSQCASGNC